MFEGGNENNYDLNQSPLEYDVEHKDIFLNFQLLVKKGL